MHYLTFNELLRIANGAPGNEALAGLLRQIRELDTLRPPDTLRVDLDALLRKPDGKAGALPSSH